MSEPSYTIVEDVSVETNTTAGPLSFSFKAGQVVQSSDDNVDEVFVIVTELVPQGLAVQDGVVPAPPADPPAPVDPPVVDPAPAPEA